MWFGDVDTEYVQKQSQSLVEDSQIHSNAPFEIDTETYR